MKYRIIACTLLLACFVAATILRSQADADDEVENNSPAVAPADSAEVAILRTSRVMREYEAFVKQMNELKAAVKAVEQDLNHDKQAIERAEAQLKLLEEGSDEYNALENVVQKDKVEFNLATKREKAKFLEQEAQFYRHAHKTITQAVGDYSKRQGIRLVLQVQEEPSDDGTRDALLKRINHSVVFHDGVDITDSIIKLLNEGEEVAQQAEEDSAVARSLPQ